MAAPVLILAGGFGIRLSRVVADLPKPLALVSGRPFLEHLVRCLVREGLTDIVLLTGYKAEKIREHFRDGSRFGARIEYSEERSPLGTGGAVHQAIVKLFPTDEDLLVLNGDSFFDMPFNYFLEFHRSKGSLATLALKYRGEVARYGTVSLANDRVTSFKEKDSTQDWGLISAGVYAINTRTVAGLSVSGPFSLEADVFPPLAAEGGLTGIVFPGKFVDIGTPKDYEVANAQLGSWMGAKARKAVFLDSDCVINGDATCVSSRGSVTFVNGALDFLRAVRDLGYVLVIVTNQPGIAEGKFTEVDCHAFMRELVESLRSERIDILDSLYCPFHPDGAIAKYRRESFDRKPSPGMLLKAADLHSIDLFSSWMVGNQESDRIALPYLRTLILQGKHPVTAARLDESFNQILEVIKHG